MIPKSLLVLSSLMILFALDEIVTHDFKAAAVAESTEPLHFESNPSERKVHRTIRSVDSSGISFSLSWAYVVFGVVIGVLLAVSLYATFHAHRTHVQLQMTTHDLRVLWHEYIQQHKHIIHLEGVVNGTANGDRSLPGSSRCPRDPFSSVTEHSSQNSPPSAFDRILASSPEYCNQSVGTPPTFEKFISPQMAAYEKSVNAKAANPKTSWITKGARALANKTTEKPKPEPEPDIQARAMEKFAISSSEPSPAQSTTEAHQDSAAMSSKTQPTCISENATKLEALSDLAQQSYNKINSNNKSDGHDVAKLPVTRM